MRYNQKQHTMRKIIFLPIVMLALLAQAQIVQQDCTELFISEYVEGSHNNKALEFYNPTPNDIILDNTYDLVRYSNGAGESIESDIQYVQPLTGTVPAYGTFIALLDRQDANGTGYDTILFADLLNIGNTFSNSAFYSTDYNSGTNGCRVMVFNGDDALGLRKNGNAVDIFGKIGEDPGYAWTDDASAGFTDANGGDWWTRDHTLIRKANIKQGVTTSPILFDPTAEWDTLATNTFTELGTHNCDCHNFPLEIETTKIKVRMYPNPSANNNILILQGEQSLGNISIINMFGQTVRKFASEQKIITINTQQLSSGTYFIQVNNADGVWEEKLIIQ